MNTTETMKARSSKELIEALSTARDRARVQLHLLSLDARDSWHELESKIDNLQAKIENDSERLGESAAKKVHELTRAAKDLLKQNGGIAELTLPAAKLMRSAQSCRPNDSLSDAARLMWELDCGAVPVVNDAGSVVGVITDRDICMAAYTRGQPLSASTVESAMATDVVTASPRAALETIASLMRNHQIRRVPIVDNGHLVGIISLADVARYLQAEAGFSAVLSVELAHTLSAICEPHHRETSAAAE